MVLATASQLTVDNNSCGWLDFPILSQSPIHNEGMGTHRPSFSSYKLSRVLIIDNYMGQQATPTLNRVTTTLHYLQKSFTIG